MRWFHQNEQRPLDPNCSIPQKRRNEGREHRSCHNIVYMYLTLPHDVNACFPAGEDRKGEEGKGKEGKSAVLRIVCTISLQSIWSYTPIFRPISPSCCIVFSVDLTSFFGAHPKSSVDGSGLGAEKGRQRKRQQAMISAPPARGHARTSSDLRCSAINPKPVM
jgi:hypothetical protein